MPFFLTFPKEIKIFLYYIKMTISLGSQVLLINFKGKIIIGTI